MSGSSGCDGLGDDGDCVPGTAVDMDSDDLDLLPDDVGAAARGGASVKLECMGEAVNPAAAAHRGGAARPDGAAVSNAQEAALVKEFYSSRLVVEALDARRVAQMGCQGGLRSSRQATTMAAILRRWFIGKQTVKKAAEKTASLPPVLSRHEFGRDNALVGTAALLELAASSDPAQSRLVTVADAPGAPGYMFMTLGVETNKRGRPVAGSPPEVVLRKYFVHKNIVEACRQWAIGHAERLGDAPSHGSGHYVQAPPPPWADVHDPLAGAASGSGEAGADPDDGWMAASAESIEDWVSSTSDGDISSTTSDDEASTWLSDGGLLVDASLAAGGGEHDGSMAEVGGGSFGGSMGSNWMEWSAADAAMMEFNSPADQWVGMSKRSRDQDEPFAATSDQPVAKASRPKSRAGKSAMLLMGFALIGLAIVGIVVTRAANGLRNVDDGWNCDHPEVSVMFGNNEAICAADPLAMFACSFDCPLGSIGVGRSCRCDGCFRDGHCMAWELLGVGKHGGEGCEDLVGSSYNYATGRTPAPQGDWSTQGLDPLAHRRATNSKYWPTWMKLPEKVPGVSEDAGAMWYDVKNGRLILNLFPSAAVCPVTENCSRSDRCWITGACPAHPAVPRGAAWANWGNALSGVWTYNLTGSLSPKWDHFPGPSGKSWLKKQFEEKNLDKKNPGAMAHFPGPRNDALTFPGADSFFVFGGSGLALDVQMKLKSKYEVLSDLWVLDSSPGHIRWSQLSSGIGSTGIPATPVGGDGAGPRQWPACVRASASWSTPCNQTARPGCTDGQLWMFGGQSDTAIGPLNTLWRYSYSEPAEVGDWTLVTGSPYEVVGFILGNEKEKEFAKKGYAGRPPRAVDECLLTWPLQRWNESAGIDYQWVSLKESRCPMARYSAATWSGDRSGRPGRSGVGGWVFGGMTSWAANLSAVVKNYSSEVSAYGIGNIRAAYDPVRPLSDLWHFNGDPVRPMWTHIEASRELSAWPPASIGSTWSDAGQLWLWVTSTERQPGCNFIHCDPPAPGQAANDLWVFSPATMLWERVTHRGVDVTTRVVSSDSELQRQLEDTGMHKGLAGYYWPAARTSPMTTGGGCMFSGTGAAECQQPEHVQSPPQALSGLWRWVAQDYESVHL